MRFITVPCFWLDEDKRVLTTNLRINPMQVEAYHASVLDYMDPKEDVPLSSDVTVIYMRSGTHFDLLMPIKEFENAYAKWMKS